MNKFNTLRFINSFLRLSYLAIIFALPLVFAAGFKLDNLFILPKLAWFWFLLAVLIFLTGYKLTLLKKINTLKGLFKFWLLPGLFVLFLGVSSYLALDVNQALFGSYDRQVGWLFYVSLFIWLAVLTINWKMDSKLFKISEIFRAIGWSGLLVSLYGILQYFGYDFIAWPEPPVLYKRAFSTLGQPNFLGSFLLFSIPVTIYLIWQVKHAWYKLFWGFCAAVSLVALAFSLSRAAWLGLFAGAVFGVVIYFISSKRKKLNRQAIISLIILAVVVVGIFSQDFFFNRVRSAFDVNHGSVTMRLIYWQASWDKIQERPLLGYGLEQQKAVLRDSYNKDWAVHEKINSYSDRAHNIIFDYLLIGGLVSLLCLILWWRQLFLLGLKIDSYRKEALTILIALFSYFVALLFSFETIVDMVYFHLMAAILITMYLHQTGNDKVVDNAVFGMRKIYKIILLAILFIAILFIGTNRLNNLVGNHFFFKSKQALLQQEYPAAALLYDYSMEKSPHQPHYTYYFSDALGFMFLNNNIVVDEVWKLKIREIYNDLDYSYDGLIAQARLQTLLEQNDVAEAKYMQAALLAPELPKTYVNLANLYFRENNYHKALAAYQTSLDKLPNINDQRINSLHREPLEMYLSYIHDNMGQVSMSLAEFEQAQHNFKTAFNYNVFDLGLLKKIADSYYLAGDLDRAIWYNQRGQLRNPKDPAWPTALSFLYFHNDQLDLSEMSLSRALELQGDYPQALELKKELDF